MVNQIKKELSDKGIAIRQKLLMDLSTIKLLLKTYAAKEFVVNQLLQSIHELSLILTVEFCSGFKRELFAYTLNYTSGLIDALVAARDPEVDPYATMLEELISKHTEGPFNDYRVSAGS